MGCLPLHFFYLEGVSEISAPQLRWVLAQSIGTIREIDLVLGTILQAPGGAGQLQARSVNWAKPEFVQLLGQLGPTLKSLALRTSTIVPSFGGGMHPGIPQNNFQNEAQSEYLVQASLQASSHFHFGVMTGG